VYSSDVYSSDVYSSDVYSSDVYNSDVYSSDVYGSDVYSSGVQHFLTQVKTHFPPQKVPTPGSRVRVHVKARRHCAL
jgi:hypothetical protein